MFLGTAPPLKTTFVVLATVTSWAIWKFPTSVAVPDNVTSLGTSSPVLHLYTPRLSVMPWAGA